MKETCTDRQFFFFLCNTILLSRTHSYQLFLHTTFRVGTTRVRPCTHPYRHMVLTNANSAKDRKMNTVHTMNHKSFDLMQETLGSLEPVSMPSWKYVSIVLAPENFKTTGTLLLLLIPLVFVSETLSVSNRDYNTSNRLLLHRCSNVAGIFIFNRS